MLVFDKLLNKYKLLPIEVKSTFWFTLCNFLLKGISLITVPLFAKYLSTEQYGIVSIFNSYQQIFFIFATLELSMGAYTRGILKYKKDLKLFENSIQMLWSMITFIIFIFTFMFNGIFIRLTETNLTIMTLMFVYFLVQPAYDCWINKKRFEYEYKSVVIKTLIFSFLSTVIPLLCVIFVDPSANIRIVSVLIIQVLFCIPFYVKGFDMKVIYLNLKKCREYWVFAIRFQLPLVFHALSYLILAQSDRIMIGDMVGKSEAALYSVAYSISNAVIIFQTSINQVLKPWRYKKMEKKEYQLISKVTNLLLLVIGIVILMFILIAPEIMKVLFNDSYYEAVWTIPPVTLSVYFMFLYSIFADIESYLCKTKYIMQASVICAIFNIILNYFGIKYISYIACGYATLISYILFSILHYHYMKKACKEENINSRVFNINFITYTSMIFLILMCLFVELYPYPFIRFLLLLLLLSTIFIKRSIVVSVLKTLKKGD